MRRVPSSAGRPAAGRVGSVPSVAVQDAGGLPHRFHFQKTQLFFISSLVFLFFYPFFPLLIEAVTQTRSSLVLLLLVFMSLLSPLALRVLLVICLWF